MRSFLESNQLARLLAVILVIASAFPGAAQSTTVPLEKDAKAAANTCKKAVRYDKQLTDLQNRTICYQAAVQGDHYARKMLHRSAFFTARALRLYLDAAIPAATPDLESDPRHTKRLQRQQAAFWRKKKDADLDLLFLQDNAGLPYRIAEDIQKGKIAEIIVHFQKGLNTNIESTPTGAPLAGRYLLSMPVGTWLIDDFEPMRLRADEPLDWMTDYIHYARSAHGNSVGVEFVALADKNGLQHFWLDGSSGSDTDFLSRNHGKGFSVGPAGPGSGTDNDGMPPTLVVAFNMKDPDAEDGSWTVDPRERAQYRIEKKDTQWFIAAFEELVPEQIQADDEDRGDRIIFENLETATSYLVQSRTLTENLRNCEPSEFTFSVPTIPAQKYRYAIQGFEGNLCRFKVMTIGAIGVLCKAPSMAIDALLTLEADTVRQLEEHTDGRYPFHISPDQGLKAKVSEAMSQACQMTMEEQSPQNLDKFVEDSFTYIKNLATCNPSTYSYSHPIVPEFTGKNVIQGYKDGNCLIDMHMPNNIIMQCKASLRTVEMMQYQTRVMLKELQDTGRYEFSIEINVGTGSTSELSNLMAKECQW